MLASPERDQNERAIDGLPMKTKPEDGATMLDGRPTGIGRALARADQVLMISTICSRCATIGDAAAASARPRPAPARASGRAPPKPRPTARARPAARRPRP